MFVVPKLASGELPIYFFYSFVMKQIMLTQIVVLACLEVVRLKTP